MKSIPDLRKHKFSVGLVEGGYVSSSRFKMERLEGVQYN